MGVMTTAEPSAVRVGTFIIVLLASGASFWTVCSAQNVRLPPTLRIRDLRAHFCNRCLEIQPTSGEMLSTLCGSVCSSPRSSRRLCWAGQNETCPNTNEELVCIFQDAVVCQQKESVCVYSEPDIEQNPFCTGSSLDGTSVALGSILAVVLLAVISVAVYWYLRSKGKVPACKTKARKRRSQSQVERGVAAKRAPIPEPRTLPSTEYSYAYGQRPGEPSIRGANGSNTVDQPDNEDHYYSTLDDEGTARSVKDATASCSPSKSTEATTDHQYFALKKTHKDGAADESDAKMAATPQEAEDQTYFPLLKTQGRPSGIDNPGYEAAGLPTPTTAGEGGDQDTSSPYDHIDRDANNKTNGGTLSDNGHSDYQQLESTDRD